ncbi:hypothetical protein Tco_0652149 [Tanacetum coccineum]|uniref:Uncharacterized protein n=1 Tax=Tanacetum coccineum TaxID=301880 RepID=A0ABQ4WX50_9ASTR
MSLIQLGNNKLARIKIPDTSTAVDPETMIRIVKTPPCSLTSKGGTAPNRNVIIPTTCTANKNEKLLRENARQLFLDDIYRNPGPLQFDGPGGDSRVRAMVKPGCSQDVVKAALSAMSSVTTFCPVMSSPSNSTT